MSGFYFHGSHLFYMTWGITDKEDIGITLRFPLPHQQRNRVWTRGYNCVFIIIISSSHRKKAEAHLRLNPALALVANTTVSSVTVPMTLTSYLTSLCLTFFTCKMGIIIGMTARHCLQRSNRLNIENGSSLCLISFICCVAIIILNLLFLYVLSEFNYPNLWKPDEF